MSAADECCFRCSNPDCRRLTCYVDTCNNFEFDADVVRTFCAYCARGETP